MRRFITLLCVCLMGSSLLLSGCTMGEAGESDKTEVEFTLVEIEDISAELLEVINKNKMNEIKMSYEDGGYTYIVRGYGEQKTGGYSISVNNVYIAEDKLHVETSLIGPPHDKKLQNEPSYPFVVIKVEGGDFEVVFDGLSN